MITQALQPVLLECEGNEKLDQVQATPCFRYNFAGAFQVGALVRGRDDGAEARFAFRDGRITDRGAQKRPRQTGGVKIQMLSRRRPRGSE